MTPIPTRLWTVRARCERVVENPNNRTRRTFDTAGVAVPN